MWYIRQIVGWVKRSGPTDVCYDTVRFSVLQSWLAEITKVTVLP